MTYGIKNVINGDQVPIAQHPMFNEIWDKYAEIKNNYIKKYNLNIKVIRELNNLLEVYGEVERLGFLYVYMLGRKEGREEVIGK